MAVPLIFADMTEEELRKYRKLASSRIYNFKNAEVRNEKSRLRMAKHRAEEALLSADELEARRARRREATQRYREKNRERLAVAEKKRRRRYLKKPELKLKNEEKFRERKEKAAAARARVVQEAGAQRPLVDYSSADED